MKFFLKTSYFRIMFTCQGGAMSCLITLLFFLTKRTYILMAAKMASANNYIFLIQFWSPEWKSLDGLS